MPSQDPVLSTVQRTLLRGKKVPDALSALGSTCSAGAQCTQVQTSPVATAALGDLKVKVDTANTSLVTKKKADQDARTAGKTLRNDVKSVRVSLGTYETAVAGVSGGDAAIITKAGLPSRPVAPTAKPPMQMVTKLTAAVGKTAKTLTSCHLCPARLTVGPLPRPSGCLTLLPGRVPECPGGSGAGPAGTERDVVRPRTGAHARRARRARRPGAREEWAGGAARS